MGDDGIGVWRPTGDMPRLLLRGAGLLLCVPPAPCLLGAGTFTDVAGAGETGNSTLWPLTTISRVVVLGGGHVATPSRAGLDGLRLEAPQTSGRDARVGDD